MLYKIPISKPCEGYYIRWYYNGWHYWHFIAGSKVNETSGENYRTEQEQSVTCGSGNLTLNQITALRTLFKSKDVYLYNSTSWVRIRINAGSQVIFRNDVEGYEMEIVFTVGEINVSFSQPIDLITNEIITNDAGSQLTNDALELIYL